MNAEQDSARIQEISHTLFSSDLASAHFVPDESHLGVTLAKDLIPDLTLSPRTPEIGFIHRKLPEGDLYFVANTDNQPKRVHANFRSKAKHAEFWDPFSGKISAISDPANIQLDLQPYESRLIFFSDQALPSQPARSTGKATEVDLSHGWRVTFANNGQTIDMPDFRSWTEDSRFLYYSGLATYEKSFDLSPTYSAPGATVILDFGPGTPVEKPSPLGDHSMRAYLESPVREAAQVYVNSKLAGCVWRPPYQLDLTAFLKPGKNDLLITVGNTAINEMSGRALPNYRLLRDRYGMLFVPQDMQNLQPLPSGITGHVTLIETSPAQ